MSIHRCHPGAIDRLVLGRVFGGMAPEANAWKRLDERVTTSQALEAPKENGA